MDLKATLVSSNDEIYNGHKCSYLQCRTKYIAFLLLICTTIAFILLTVISLGWSLPPSVLLTGA